MDHKANVKIGIWIFRFSEKKVFKAIRNHQARQATNGNACSTGAKAVGMGKVRFSLIETLWDCFKCLLSPGGTGTDLSMVPDVEC